MTILSDLLEAATNLPPLEVERLAKAVASGATAVDRVRAQTGSPTVRTACEYLGGLLSSTDGRYLAGWLDGVAAAAQHSREHLQLDVVWTGPQSEIDTSRFTSEVIVDLIGEARQTLLLASYAAYPQTRVLDALTEAVERAVDVTVLYERSEDNPAFHSGADPFAILPVRRLVWPVSHRPEGAALHPKLVVVDEKVALVGSANLTGRGLDVNMECGILIRGARYPKAITDHIWSLVRSGDLTNLGGPALSS